VHAAKEDSEDSDLIDPEFENAHFFVVIAKNF
jgi:hypothetical protein